MAGTMDPAFAAAIRQGEALAEAYLQSLTEVAVAAERERCAKIVVEYAETSAWDPEEEDDLKILADRIRSGE